MALILCERRVSSIGYTHTHTHTHTHLQRAQYMHVPVVVESVGDPNHFSAGVKTDGRLGGQQ